MKLENYNTLKEMLLEFKRELGETDREIALHLRYIKEAEAHLKAFTEAETEDFKVFSPRKMEIIHKEEIDKIRNEKSFYEERNRELYRRKEYLDRRILKLTDILEKESGDLVLQEEKKPDLYSDHAKDLEEVKKKPVLREFLEQNYFERYLVIDKKETGERSYQLYNAKQERLC